MTHERGILIVLSGPSGAGKSTVIASLMKRRDDVRFSVSATTREPRPGEVHGKDYYFITREQFDALAAGDALLEHAEYVGNCYGTPAGPVEQCLEQGFNVLLDIETQGAAQVMATRPDAVSLFLCPPSLAELERRLRGRGTDSEAKVQGRLAAARREFAEAKNYTYIVVNSDVEKAAQELDAIITAELCRSERRYQIIADAEGEQTL